MKLSNTRKHFTYSLPPGAAWFFIALLLKTPDLHIFVFIGYFFVTYSIETAQRLRAQDAAKKAGKEFHWNWIDSIVDIIAGNAGFHAAFWLLTYIATLL